MRNDEQFSKNKSFLISKVGAGGVSLDTILTEEKIAQTALVGLHVCGDLLPDSCRLFASCQQIRIMVMVGCCYNIMTEAKEDIHWLSDYPQASDAAIIAPAALNEIHCDGFPLSSFSRLEQI